MKKLLTLFLFTLLSTVSCNKDHTPDLLPGTWYGEDGCERNNGGYKFHLVHKYQLSITYLSPSKSYDVEVKDLSYVSEHPEKDIHISKFHLNNNKIVVESGDDYIGLNGALVKVLDEKNLILELDRPEHEEYIAGSGTVTIDYDSNSIHFRRQD